MKQQIIQVVHDTMIDLFCLCTAPCSINTIVSVIIRSTDQYKCSSFHNSRLKCKEDKKYKCFESYFLSFGSDAVKLVINAGNRLLFKLMFNLLSYFLGKVSTFMHLDATACVEIKMLTSNDSIVGNGRAQVQQCL